MSGPVLVTGAGGTVGRHMRASLEHAGLDAVLLTHADLDVRDGDAVRRRVVATRPRAVIHLAAKTNVDACEREREDAVAANMVATEHVAAACRAIDALCIYVSTGGVFAGRGTDGPFNELDTPRPANWYAETKLAGEDAARRAGRWSVVRAGFVVGGGLADAKFVGTMLRLMSSQPQVRAVGDRLGTLTFASELADYLAAVAARDAELLSHYASPGVVSRYDVAVELARLTSASAEVVSVSHDTFDLPAPRGRSEAVTTVRPADGLPQPSPWRDALRQYVDELGASVGASA